MKLKNKFLAVMMVATAFMAFVGMTALASEPSMSISADKTTVKAGETFTITVSIAGNPGITSFNAAVDANSNFVLASTGAVDTKLLNGPYLEAASKNPYYLNWNDGVATANNTSNGAIATMTYTVAENTSAGTYPITVTSDAGNTMNLDWDEFDFGTATINITVAADEPVVETKTVGFATTVANVEGKTGVRFTITTNDANVTAKTKTYDVPFTTAVESKGTNCVIGLNVTAVPSGVTLTSAAALY